MGLLKKILGSMKRTVQDPDFQMKAVLKVEKIAEGEKVLAPEYPKEAARKKKAMEDPKITEEINKKREDLVDKINKNIKITSTDPPERWTPVKALPTRESEWEHRYDPCWEHFFYEPPLEKMEKNRLMLKEALELLRIRVKTEGDLAPTVKQDERWKLYEHYDAHPATQRVEHEKLERLWQYFRPFVYQKDQVVAHKHEVETLDAYAQGILTAAELWEKNRRQKETQVEEKRIKSIKPPGFWEEAKSGEPVRDSIEEAKEKLLLEVPKIKEFMESEMKRLEERSKMLKELEKSAQEQYEKALQSQDKKMFAEYEKKLGRKPNTSETENK